MSGDEWAERVRRALDEALPGAEPIRSLHRLDVGWSNENWIGETALGRVVVKVGLPDSNAEKFRCAANALTLARAAGVAAPELVAFEASSTALGGRVLRVFSYLDGQAPHAVLDVPANRTRFLGQLGEAVARLHSIELPEFTSRIGTTGGFARWSDFLSHRWPNVVERSERAGLDGDLVATAGGALRALSTRFDDVTRPVVCHRDLYLDNLLCDGDGNLVAILDFDLAEAWEPAADFHKLRWWVFEDDADAERAFLSGYGDAATRSAEFDDRVRLVEIIDLVNGLANWLVQDGGMGVHAEARLRRILAP